jgi:tRNA threonylcarbamoyladenosine biosynthesis protein TsaE
MKIDLPDADATSQLGATLAAALRPGDTVCLFGPLGAGKSTLARGLIRALTTPDEEVPSPTFTLVQTYDAGDLVVAHFDLYRLTDPDEIHELGLDEALDEGAALIEWPERLEGRLPPDRLDIVIAPEGEGRVATLTFHGGFEGRTIEF